MRCRRARFVVTTPADNLSTAGAGFKSLSLPSPLRTALNLVVSLLLTFLGLLFVTFIIGRVVPIDPVLAIVGDRAPGHVVERVREELGLNRPPYENGRSSCRERVCQSVSIAVVAVPLKQKK